MGNLRVTFTPALVAPTNGYVVKYKKANTTDPFSEARGTTSPIDITVQDGWEYIGSFHSDCAGVLSPGIPFNAQLPIAECYVYTFFNYSSQDRTISFRYCNSPSSQTDLILGVGNRVDECIRTDFIFVDGIVVSPGLSSQVINGVNVSRASDGVCLP